MEGNGLRTRSFRYEDYNNRRVFLRSYPLQWGGEEENNEETVKVTNESTEKKPIKGEPVKKIFLSILNWGREKALVLTRLKHKFTIYIIACVPVRLKSRTALISG